MQIIKSTITLATFALILGSCGEKETRRSETNQTEKSKTEIQEQNAQDNRGDEQTSQPIQLRTNPQTSTGNNTATQVTPPGINPPHGQPGHDCSIPVGQPLDGSKLNMTNSSTPQTPTFKGGPRVENLPQAGTRSTTTTTTTTSQTAPGMNPPHGQPGHVCGIPVGSPLPEGN
jgi:hypothetical protein